MYEKAEIHIMLAYSLPPIFGYHHPNAETFVELNLQKFSWQQLYNGTIRQQVMSTFQLDLYH